MKYLEILNRHQKTISIIGIALALFSIILFLVGLKVKMVHFICPYFIFYSIFGYLDTKKEGPTYINKISKTGFLLLPVLYFLCWLIILFGKWELISIVFSPLILLYAILYSITGLYWLDKEKYQFKSIDNLFIRKK